MSIYLTKFLILSIAVDLIRDKPSALHKMSVKVLFCFSFLILSLFIASIFLYPISYPDLLENYTLMFDNPGNNGGPEAGGSGGNPEPNNGGPDPKDDTLPYNSEEDKKRFKS
jgi:hypothetical protein